MILFKNLISDLQWFEDDFIVLGFDENETHLFLLLLYGGWNLFWGLVFLCWFGGLVSWFGTC